MSSQRKILVTAALPYANGPLHLGHMLGYIEADIWVKLQKMQGHDCLYICGSDGHGTPIMIQAEKMGMTPEAMIAEVQKSQEQDFADFYVDFDNYISTHSPENKTLVEMIFKRHVEKGHIHKREIKQLFDPIKQLFLPDRYIKGECPRCHSKDQYGDNCEICGATYLPIELINPYSTLSGAKPIEKTSEHYFFKLNQFESFLKNWTHADHLQIEVKNKLDEWFKVGLQEWDISRDAPYFGFLIPGEKDKYFYVWLDAPIGYMASFQNLCDKRKDLDFSAYWGKESQVELYQFIGKDIVNFHALFWPALLEGADFRTPTKIFVNGYLTVNGQKMSKSRGTFIKARTYLHHLKPEYLRYYFAAKLSDKIEDLDINFDDFMLRINADLVGKLINIASRCASFLTKHFNGRLSAKCAEPLLAQQFSDAGKQIADKWERLQFSQAIRQVMELADRANQYIDEKKPWALMKDPGQHEQVQAVCSVGINLFRILMIYLKPVLPETAKEVELFLNSKPFEWRDKDYLLLDHVINEFKPLIQRIDLNQIEALKMAAKEDIQSSTQTSAQVSEAATNIEKKPEKTEISIDDFNKIDLRVAKIIHAEAIKGADKLLRLQVELEEGDKRQVFAGIKSAYQPEQLIGRYVVMIANLAPRKMRFGVSEGMILAAGGKDQLWLISPDEGAESGFKVK